MKLEVEIHKVKCVNNLKILLPTRAGLYAITGQNGSGKSTIVSCASSVFFDLKKDDYFGFTDIDAYIKFSYDGGEKIWAKDDKNVWICNNYSSLGLQGFYEGSLIFGNRFKDTSYDKLHELDKIDFSKLSQASDFIRKNLGLILQGDEEYYEKLWKTPFAYNRFNGEIYFYEKNGIKVSQFHMSTGENLLVSILNSLFIKNKKHNKKANVYFNKTKGNIIFLDEIELALHPSSLKRLVQFLEDMSAQYGYAIYFSTHSIELIGCIKPEHIFYVERHADNTTEIINPCYPAYATRNLYNHEGYDKVILVEDDLARAIVDKLLKKEKLLNSRLVHILPCGGYVNVIDLADDVVRNNLLGNRTSVCMVIDRDVMREAKEYKKKKELTIPLGFLPVTSLEKYLREVLILHVDHKLFRILESYIFLNKSLQCIIDDYKKDPSFSLDSRGKILYRYLNKELLERRKSREDLIEIIVDYWIEQKMLELSELIKYLTKVLS